MKNLKELSKKELKNTTGGLHIGLFTAGVLVVIGGAATLNPLAIIAGASLILAS